MKQKNEETLNRGSPHQQESSNSNLNLILCSPQTLIFFPQSLLSFEGHSKQTD